MFSDNGRISSRQLQAIIILFILCACIDENYKWPYVIAAGLFSLPFAAVYDKILENNVCCSYPKMCERVFGKYAGALVLAGVCVAVSVFLCASIGVFSKVMTDSIFENMPAPLYLGLFFLPAVYASQLGIETCARASEIIFTAIFFTLAAAFAYTIYGVGFSGEGLAPIFDGSVFSSEEGYLANFCKAFSAFSFTSAAVFFTSYVKPEKNSVKQAVIVLTAVLLLFSVLCGGESLTGFIGGTELFGSFVERQEIMMTWMWTAVLFISAEAAVFVCGGVYAHFFKIKKSLARFLACTIIFLPALFIKDISAAYAMRRASSFAFAVIYAVAVPFAVKIKEEATDK